MFKWILLVICVINLVNGLRNSSINFNNQNVTFSASLTEASFSRHHLPWFLKLSPFFDLTKYPEVSETCRHDFQIFLDALERLDLWALKMHDATAKVPSGVFNGNLNQYGDYDMCLNVIASEDEFQGKYCIAYAQPRSRNGTFKDLLKLVQSHEFFKSNFDDCGHRTPRFSHINWAVCIPSSCSAKDLEIGIKTYLDEYSENTDIIIDVKVDEDMCQLKRETSLNALDKNTRRVILLLVTILSICALSTIYDMRTQMPKNEWFTTFSLSRNIHELLNTNENPNDIQTVHGIRMLNALVLMATHKSMSLLFNPFTNRSEMTKRLANPFLLVYASAASLYTDVFLMLSGCLTVYTFYGRLQKGKQVKLWREILDRYFRIIPSVIFLILFCTFILPLLGSGPMWNLVVTSHAEICKKYWWRNMLFLQNWFGYNSICLTNTHHVGIDMQLFVAATILTPILYKYPKRGLQLIIGLALLSTVARFYVTIVHELSIHIFFGISLQKIAEVADRMYIIPPFRFTVYAMGMILGYVLRRYKNYIPTDKIVRLGWTTAFLSFVITSIASIRLNFPDHVYNKLESGMYAAFAPAGWCLFSAWIIYISEKGSNNPIVQIFRLKVQRFFTKIAFAVYLTQFPIFFYNVGKVRNAEYFEFWKVMYNVEELTTIFVCSVILYLLIEAPFNNIRKLLFDKKVVTVKKVD